MESETDSPRPDRPPSPLPVLRILLEGVSLPAKRAATLVRFAGLFIVVLALVIVAIPDDPDEIEGVEVALILLVWLPLLLAAFTLAAVVCHRVFVLGDESMIGQGLVWWSSRETRFLGWLIGLGFCAATITVLGMIVSMIVGSMMTNGDQEPSQVGIVGSLFLVDLVVAYFVGRWSLVLPATAIDDRPSLSWAWSTSRGNGLRLMVLVGLFPMGVNFASTFLPETRSVVDSILLAPVWLYVWAVEIALLSLSYRELVRHQVTDVEDG